MRCGSLTRALAAAALAAALAVGCARPPDEAWLRFLGFKSPGGSTGVSYHDGHLRDGTTETVDAEFENVSVTVGRSEGGTGILIDRVRLEYSLPGYTPPVYDFPLALYLAAPGNETSTGTLSSLPLVPASLKDWIIASGVPLGREVQVTARVRFFALTDDGSRLEVGASLVIVLLNP